GLTRGGGVGPPTPTRSAWASTAGRAWDTETTLTSEPGPSPAATASAIRCVSPYIDSETITARIVIIPIFLRSPPIVLRPGRGQQGRTSPRMAPPPREPQRRPPAPAYPPPPRAPPRPPPAPAVVGLAGPR